MANNGQNGQLETSTCSRLAHRWHSCQAAPSVCGLGEDPVWVEGCYWRNANGDCAQKGSRESKWLKMAQNRFKMAQSGRGPGHFGPFARESANLRSWPHLFKERIWLPNFCRGQKWPIFLIFQWLLGKLASEVNGDMRNLQYRRNAKTDLK